LQIKPETESFLKDIRKPLTYVGAEENSYRKEKTKINFCLIYPDLYELGIESLGITILYSILNQNKDVFCQRAYMPDLDMLAKLKQKKKTLFSLEENRELKDFDILGFSLPHELCYTNILKMLELSQIPLRSSERDDDHPLVIAGGCGSQNPLPLSPFIDVFVIGEAEEVILEIVQTIKKLEKENNKEKIKAIAELEGVWVPKISKNVNRRIINDLNKVKYKPLVPITKTENRMVVELMRGCVEGCRFCQAGFIYRPLREKEASICYKDSIENIKAHGFSQLSLLSLSTSDYSQVKSLTAKLAQKLSQDKISISLPSLRINDFATDILEGMAYVKKTGLTFAIEAGSERLRKVINKNLSEKSILEVLGSVFSKGWHKLKLYFMVGLPTEKQEDLEELVSLLHKIVRTAKDNLPASLKKRLNITVNVSNFVPKAHTPFQWVKQDSIEEMEEKHSFLMRNIRGPYFKLRWHDSKQSAIEGFIARGDEKVADALERAYELGAIFDNFSDRFDFNIWDKAIKETKLSLSEYGKKRSEEKKLAWDFIDTGVDKNFLKEEYIKSLKAEQTPSCRKNTCPKCGLCDREVKNTFSNKFDVKVDKLEQKDFDEKFKYRLILNKDGVNRYLSQLEWASLIERKLRKTGLRLGFRGKFNPRPRLSFSPALPVGFSSGQEFVDFVIVGKHKKTDLVGKLIESFKGGTEFVELLESESSSSEIKKATYEVKLEPGNSPINIFKDIEKFISENNHKKIDIPKKDRFLSISLDDCILKNNKSNGRECIKIVCPLNVRPDVLIEVLATKVGRKAKIKEVKRVGLH